MSRLYHSASSDALGQRCARAWWYRYVAGLKEPEVKWSAIAHYVADRDGKTWRDPANHALAIPSRARSTSLGKEMHARHEARYLGEFVNWRDLPGEIALSGLHFLPQPDKTRALVEHPIGNAAIVGAADAHAPPVGFRVAGILWAGYRDLLAYSPEEWARLGVASPRGWALVDYKSTASVERYALTPAELFRDFAANLYALASMEETDTVWMPARWVYFETKRRRYAEPRDTVIPRGDAFQVVAAGSERARALDAITSETAAPANTSACEEYGGCPYHHTRGGPCSARRSFGGLLSARIAKDRNMSLPPGITSIARPNGAPQPAQGGQFAPPPGGFAPPTAPAQPQGQFAPPPAEPQPAQTDAPAPPPPAVSGKGKGSRKATATAAPGEPAARSGDVYDFVIDGNFGPLTLSGDARDVITAAKLLRGA